MPKFRRPSHATLVAYLALFVALGGTAAVALPGKNSVESDDIKRNAVKGADVNERSLNGVLQCPSALRGHEGLCVDRSNRPAADWQGALLNCAQRKLRLPTVGEGLVLVRRLPRDNTQLWTSLNESANDVGIVVLNEVGVGPNLAEDGSFSSHTYRCVTVPRD